VNVSASSDSTVGASSAANALDRPGRDQDREVWGGAARRGRGREAHQPGEERPLPAERVREPAAEQQQAAERQRVGGDDPLPLRVGDVQRALRGRQRDVDDRGVERHHQLGQRDERERQPAPGICRARVPVHAGSIDV
jgi:hypothetical protein